MFCVALGSSSIRKKERKKERTDEGHFPARYGFMKQPIILRNFCLGLTEGIFLQNSGNDLISLSLGCQYY